MALSRNTWIRTAFILGVVTIVAGPMLMVHALNVRMLRADPNRLSQDLTLNTYAMAVGEAGYQSHCASCHGAKAKGDPSRGVPDLTDQDWLYGEGRVQDIERVVTYGIRSGNPKGWRLAEMPAYATATPSVTEKVPPLAPQDISDVAQYLLLLEDRPTQGQAARRGAEIYAKRGGCFDCHGADARGDSAIGAPNLIDHIWLYGDGSAQAIYTSIARGHHGTCPAFIGRVSASAIRAISVYVHSLSHLAREGGDLDANAEARS